MTEHGSAEHWDEFYGATARVWSGDPNPQLVREAGDLTPGTALDAGCGEGADAHWLAGRGWRVTAVDVSEVALRRGAERATPDIADLITWHQADLTNWAPEQRAYDLVSAQFLHLPAEVRAPLFARLAAAVAPGGTLLVVGHHPSDMHSAVHRPAGDDLYFTAEEVATTLDADAWEVLATDTRSRGAHDHDGHEATIRDAVLRARRRS